MGDFLRSFTPLLGYRYLLRNVWLALGSALTISGIFGIRSGRTPLDTVAWAGTQLGIPQGFSGWIAAVQSWLTRPQTPSSLALSIIIGLGLAALIAFSESHVMPSVHAAPTLLIAVALVQETGISGWDWGWIIMIPAAALIHKGASLHKAKDLREPLSLAALEVFVAIIYLPLVLFALFYMPSNKRATQDD